MENSSAKPLVTLTVQGYKNTEMLRLCLASIKRCMDPKIHEVIVADGETGLETRQMMADEFPSFQFIPHKENVGFGRLVNVCIERARGRYIFVINPDTILEEDTIKDLTAFMEQNPQIGITGPRQKNFNGEVENTRFGFYKPQTILYRRTFLRKFSFAKKHLAEFEMKGIDSKEPYPASWLMGSALFFRSEMLEIVGGMDTQFFMYMEDVDLCRRFWEKGFKVYFHPGITLFHFYGKGSAKGNFVTNILFNRLTWVHIASAIKYFWKYRHKKAPVIMP